jgi:D-threo-aldose 1-dehydrogenase
LLLFETAETVLTHQTNKIGLGCASIGNLYEECSDASAKATIDAAWDIDIRYFDTAPLYGLGLSERRVGDALHERPRDEYWLSTKVGRLLDPDCSFQLGASRYGFANPLPFSVTFDYSYDGVMRSFEDSLSRLRLSRIDYLLVHDIGEATHGDGNRAHFAHLADGGYRALDELRDNGDISAIGLGVNEWQICADAMEIGRWDCFLLAGRYTLLEQEPLHGFLPQCEAHGAKIILGGVFNSGILATGTRSGGAMNYNYAPAPLDIVDRVSRIENVCEQHDVPLAAAALQFVLAHPIVQHVIPGIGDSQRVHETKWLIELAIPGAFWEQLADDGLIDPLAPLPKADG